MFLRNPKKLHEETNENETPKETTEIDRDQQWRKSHLVKERERKGKRQKRERERERMLSCALFFAFYSPATERLRREGGGDKRLNGRWKSVWV